MNKNLPKIMLIKLDQICKRDMYISWLKTSKLKTFAVPILESINNVEHIASGQLVND